MTERSPDPMIPHQLQTVLDQLLEVARALLPGGASEVSCEVTAGGQAFASATQVSADASQSRRVVLFGCAELLRTADQRVLDAELRRVQRTTHVPIGALVAFQWRESGLQPYTAGLPLPDC